MFDIKTKVQGKARNRAIPKVNLKTEHQREEAARKRTEIIERMIEAKVVQALRLLQS